MQLLGYDRYVAQVGDYGAAISTGMAQAHLAAWIVEKFKTWSDCGEDIESSFSKDHFLENVMLDYRDDRFGDAALL